MRDPICIMDEHDWCARHQMRHLGPMRARVLEDSEDGAAYRLALDNALVDHKSPNLLQKAVSLGKAVVTHAITGFEYADQQTLTARMAICDICEHYRKAVNTCNLCGCSLQSKMKMASQHCPIDKW